VSADDWFSRLEQQLEQQLDAFLQANPGQAQQLELQEQRERLQRLQRQRLELQSGAERERQQLLELAAEIAQWQERVTRARNAGATELAERAEAHLAGLMARGRDRWQALAERGARLQQLEAELQAAQAAGATAGAAGPAAKPRPEPGDDLDQAWARFEADQELEQLRRRQHRNPQG
jgi:hercynine metabolism protein